MIRNISLEELENMATSRALERARRFEIFDSKLFKRNAFFAANDILKECELNTEVWLRCRGERVYLFSEIDRRILAEFHLDGEFLADGLIRRPKAILLGRRGFLKEKTIGDLIAGNIHRERFRNKNRRSETCQS